MFGTLGIDRLAMRVAADVLARDLIEASAAHPARDASGGAVAVAAPDDALVITPYDEKKAA